MAHFLEALCECCLTTIAVQVTWCFQLAYAKNKRGVLVVRNIVDVKGSVSAKMGDVG